jgi:ABC-2 type transport system permease protein
MTPATKPPAPIALSHWVAPTAAWTLLSLSVARLCRGRRLLALGLLFALPVAFASLLRAYGDTGDITAEDQERILIFLFIPQALLPLSALLFASGMVQDEVEEQTLTYLLIRPLPRWLIYAEKLLASVLVATGLTALFTAATFLVIDWGSEGLWADVPMRAVTTVGLMALSLLAYTSVFGLLSLIVRRALAFGVAYIVLFEGIFANVNFVVRRLSVMYHFRVLAGRLLDVSWGAWSISEDEAPGVRECILTLLIASAVATALGATLFSVREFRVKTPEGS